VSWSRARSHEYPIHNILHHLRSIEPKDPTEEWTLRCAIEEVQDLAHKWRMARSALMRMKDRQMSMPGELVDMLYEALDKTRASVREEP